MPPGNFFLFPILFLPFVIIFLIFILLIPFLILYFYLKVTEEAFELIGFRTHHALLMTVGSLLGSFVDIPLYRYDAVTIAINVGGALIPLFITLELFLRRRLDLKRAFAGILAVTLICYYVAEPLRGVGIVMPFYVSPLLAGVCGGVLGFRRRSAPALAYVSGTMGTLMGADLMNILNPEVLEYLSRGFTGKLSIGGAGIFDGIFLTGILSVFLAALISAYWEREKEVWIY